MGFFDRFLQPQIDKRVNEIVAVEVKQIEKRIEENANLQKKEYKKIQASLGLEGSQNLYDVTYGFFDNPFTQIDFTDSWVKFTEYRDIVYQIYMRYAKRTPFGASTVKTAIQFLSAWSVKDITVTSESKDNQEFFEEFARQVKLDRFISELSTRAELQGHVLVKIVSKKEFSPKTKKEELKFKLIIIPFLKYQYILKINDYLEYDGYKYTTKTNDIEEVSKDLSEFFPVYGFDSDYTNSAFPIPSIGYVLENCDTIDKCHENIRRTNKNFARKTPLFSTKDQQTADRINAEVRSTDWNQTHIMTAVETTLSQVGADNEGVDVLIKEKLIHTQTIGGICGIPIDKLGHPEMYSSQSVRLENSESINVNAAPKRTVFIQGLESLLAKCVTIYNNEYGKTLDPCDFKVLINESAMSLQERKAVMLNDAVTAGMIDQQYYLENHPIISDDAEEILERMTAEKEKAKAEMNDRMSKALGDTPKEDLPNE